MLAKVKKKYYKLKTGNKHKNSRQLHLFQIRKKNTYI